IQYSMDDDLAGSIQNELTCSYKQQANKFRDARGLQFLLSTQMDDLMKSQKTVQDAVKKLEGPPSQQVIEEATFCHLRPVRLPLNNCVFFIKHIKFVCNNSKILTVIIYSHSLYSFMTNLSFICRTPKEMFSKMSKLLSTLQNCSGCVFTSQDKSTGGLNPEPCPICWAVLTCRHCFCNECIAIIVEQYSVGNRRRAIKCAICRQTTSHSEISYVFTTQSTHQGQDIPVKVRDNSSTPQRVEAVVRVLKKIQMTDLWQGVLDIIAKALFDNNIEFAQINGIHKFQVCVEYSDSLGDVISKLHYSFDFCRPTFVHRFLIKSTIEERMQAMLKTAEKS
uniref:RING-type domain-containing protein n=1 Tax=Sinocyclocheilus grahami TaxID=75366 RepID=A0A672S6M3_SINGR